jgi:3-oxoacyl-[acyl-carrier protein] reductase
MRRAEQDSVHPGGIELRRLEGRVALITGGSRGFGRATALRFAAEGADVAICYRAAREAAEEVVRRVEAEGRRALAIKADVADAEAARAFVRRALRELGRIDVLVNNAGIRHISPFAEQDPAAWREIVDTNVWGVLVPTHEALPAMLERGGGRIINVSSQQAHVGWENFAVYAGTKGFILAFTKSLAREVGPRGITVNAVCPGPIVTDMNRANTPPERERAIAASVPLRRMGDPEDVAAAAAFLASSDGAFITGQCIDVNGGRVMV